MGYGLVSREFYIARYIYLTTALDKLPKAVFTRLGDYEGVCIRMIDSSTGKEVRKRITEKNKEWERYKNIAQCRVLLEEQLKKLLANWKADHKGSLKDIAKDYELLPNTENVFDSNLYKSFKNCTNPMENDYPVSHNNILMRSQFEAEVAGILDEMGLDYKYEVSLNLGYQKPFYTDFALHYPEYNRCGFMEVLGGLSGFKYVNRASFCFDAYTNAGLYPNRDIVYIPGDREYRPDQETIKRMIAVMSDALARQYLRKKV